MSEATIFNPFGRRAARLTSSDLLLALEEEEQKEELFREVDSLAAFVIRRSLKGEVTVIVERTLDREDVAFTGFDSRQEELLKNIYSLEQQHSRGTWFLPEKATLKAGLANLPAIFSKYPRFAHQISAEASARVIFAESPASVFVWVFLEPLLYQLFLPLEIRASWSGLKSREEHLSAWSEIDRLIAALGLKLDEQLAVMRYGGSWGRLSSDEQIKAKQNLLATIADQASDAIAKRFRAFCCLDLISHYYDRARDGKATRRRALNRTVDRKALAAFFHGDWLRFLQYLGEQPHPDEQLATAIPQTRFFVGGAKSPAAVAQETGVSLEEVERVLATYWDIPGAKTRQLVSPGDTQDGEIRISDSSSPNIEKEIIQQLANIGIDVSLLSKSA